jgi:cytochrome c-type biogenesis protein CcmH/NrfG
VKPDARPRWTDAEPEEAQLMANAPSTTARCPPPELVHAAREGILPSDLQARVMAHADRCGICGALAEVMTDLAGDGLTDVQRARILARVRSGIASSRAGRSWSFSWLRHSAVLAGTVGAIVVIGLGALIVNEIAREAPHPEPPAIARAAQPASSMPSVLNLEKAPIRLPAGRLLWRGSESDPRRDTARELAHAVDPYERNNFTEAASRLRALTSRTPASAEAQLYLGISELFLGHNSEAVTALVASGRLAGDDADLAGDALWYLALAYRRLGQTEQAARTLEALCRGRTVRAAVACAAVLELSRPDGPAR